MLKLTIKLSESFNDETQEFIAEEFDLELEHSLVTLSKWESKHEKAFLSKTEKTDDEVMDYISTMIMTPVYPSDILDKFSEQNMRDVETYLNAKMTATWFPEYDEKGKPNRETITAELVYYWITSYGIPWEVQHWHINKLFTLIKVFNAKNSDKKKMSSAEIAARNREINERRKRELGTTG